MPILLLHGGQDTTVHPHHSRDFAMALEKIGADVTLIEVPDESHRDKIASRYQHQIADFLLRPAQIDTGSREQP